MIKFFRKIRQRLLTGNPPAGRTGKFSKYVLYAIGEIILVVIGILIALQINNWNTRNKTRVVEIGYLKEISKNLEKDAHDIQFNIEFNEIRLHSSQTVLDYLDSNEIYSDTMDTYFGGLLYTTRTLVDYSAFEALQSRGLEIISDDSLRQMISTLYSFQYHNTIDFEIQDDHALQYDVVMPAVLKKLSLRPATDTKNGGGQQLARPRNFETLKGDDDFKNALVLNIELREYMLNNYRFLENKVAACQERILIELDNLEN